MEKLKIMVVDDEARMRKLVKDFLVKSNFDVLEAGDGEAAVDKFYENKDIALILLDVMMPSFLCCLTKPVQVFQNKRAVCCDASKRRASVHLRTSSTGIQSIFPNAILRNNSVDSCFAGSISGSKNCAPSKIYP